MAILINCFECGEQMSSVLRMCPHCSKKPFPEICRVCEQPAKPSELVRGVHAPCINHLKSVNREFYTQPCSVCSFLLSLSNKHKSCPQCGHPFTTIDCYVCREPMFYGVGTRQRIFYWTDGEWPSYVADDGHFHPTCYNSFVEARALRNRQLLGPEWRWRCKVCLERLAWWERIFGNDRHVRCDLKLERVEIFPEDKVTTDIYIKSFA